MFALFTMNSPDRSRPILPSARVLWSWTSPHFLQPIPEFLKSSPPVATLLWNWGQLPVLQNEASDQWDNGPDMTVSWVVLEVESSNPVPTPPQFPELPKWSQELNVAEFLNPIFPPSVRPKCILDIPAFLAFGSIPPGDTLRIREFLRENPVPLVAKNTDIQILAR